ncbi:MAG: hypothetical protein R3330_11650 [Saprospiraceae bacterium]|nr:hypothetical protein [Saprospiraceae bacterium]
MFQMAVTGTAAAGNATGLFSKLLAVNKILLVTMGAGAVWMGVKVFQPAPQLPSVSGMPVAVAPDEPLSSEESIKAGPVMAEEENMAVTQSTNASRDPQRSVPWLSTRGTEVASDTGQRNLTTVLDRALPVPAFPPPFAVKDTSIIRFVLTEQSTESDFVRVLEAAEKAGIRYFYRVHHQRKKKTKDTWLVRDFDIDMYIPDTDLSSSYVLSVPENFTFSVEISWAVGEDGRAIGLGESFRYDENGKRE